MIMIEVYTRKAFPNASDDFIRGASWGFEGYILQLVKGEALNYEEKLIALGGFTADYIETEEYAVDIALPLDS